MKNLKISFLIIAAFCGNIAAFSQTSLPVRYPIGIGNSRERFIVESVVVEEFDKKAGCFPVHFNVEVPEIVVWSGEVTSDGEFIYYPIESLLIAQISKECRFSFQYQLMLPDPVTGKLVPVTASGDVTTPLEKVNPDKTIWSNYGKYKNISVKYSFDRSFCYDSSFPMDKASILVMSYAQKPLPYIKYVPNAPLDESKAVEVLDEPNIDWEKVLVRQGDEVYSSENETETTAETATKPAPKDTTPTVIIHEKKDTILITKTVVVIKNDSIVCQIPHYWGQSSETIGGLTPEKDPNKLIDMRALANKRMKEWLEASERVKKQIQAAQGNSKNDNKKPTTTPDKPDKPDKPDTPDTPNTKPSEKENTKVVVVERETTKVVYRDKQQGEQPQTPQQPKTDPPKNPDPPLLPTDKGNGKTGGGGQNQQTDSLPQKPPKNDVKVIVRDRKNEATNEFEVDSVYAVGNRETGKVTIIFSVLNKTDRTSGTFGGNIGGTDRTTAFAPDNKEYYQYNSGGKSFDTPAKRLDKNHAYQPRCV